ncbi:MAG: glycosyltransferase [Magnetovibrio sp.]|nr:glycosyltransferase [Magnetovibrio sp.]
MILLPLGDVEHGNINRLSAGLGDGFARLKPEFIDYRADAEPPWRHLDGLIGSGRVRAIVAMNGVGFPAGSDDFLAAHDIRLFVFGTDHPCHLYPLMEAAPPGAVLSFPTASNLAFAARRMRADLGYMHVPHAAQPRPVRPCTERDIDVLMVGNLRQSAAAQLAVWETRGAETPILQAMREIYLGAGAGSLEAIGERALDNAGGRGSPLDENRAFAKILRYFDPYARSLLRETVLHAVRDLPVHVVGDWSGLTAAPAGACHLAGPADAAEVHDLIGRAKIVVNAVPAYYRSHERVFEAMAAGAVTVGFGPTDFDALNESGAVVTLADPSDTGEAIAGLLADDATLAARGEAARAQHAANHGWTDRARIIEDALSGG